ncbi:MAG: hypothetical protein KBS85_05420 [Lachnospiraceae bacterium]|nr:hypothetical protein [Candidatus Merdinaster equi]
MQSHKITDQKNFMSALFAGEIFDSYYLKELHIVTKMSCHIDGRHIKDFYSTDELSAMPSFPEFVLWKDAKPLAFDMIKGKSLPVRFQIILLESSASSCHLTIRYENSECQVISGYSYNSISEGIDFISAKEKEKEWDKTLSTFLSDNNLT